MSIDITQLGSAMKGHAEFKHGYGLGVWTKP
jgi:hypothetical protein